MTVRHGAEAFRHEGNYECAVLLVHGFTGSPASMRPWGEHLHRHGYAVACPRLPGHGTRWQDMAASTWQEWYAEVLHALRDLRADYPQVFVAGLSMGAALALKLAEECGDEVAGLLLVNPSVLAPSRPDVPVLRTLDKVRLLGVLTRIIATVPGIKNDIKKPGQDEIAYDEVPVRSAVQLFGLQHNARAGLSKVTQPLVVFSSQEDHVVEPVNSATVIREVSSAMRTQVLLPDSYHVATLDNDAETIFAESLAFLARYAPRPAEATPAARTRSASTRAPRTRSSSRPAKAAPPAAASGVTTGPAEGAAGM